MRFITPVTITDAMLLASSIAETDAAAWNALTAYTAGQRVIRTTSTTHSIYERLVNGTTATAPESDTTNWVRVGPTNRWCMFDRATGTVSSGTDTISVTIAPGMVRALALLDVTANSVTVTMSNAGSTVYTRTVSLNTGYGVTSWDTYFFTEVVLKRTVVLTDIPPYSGGEITVTIDGTGTVSVGTVVAGSLFEVGRTRYGVGLGIIDYSKKETDAFGATSVTERAFAKRMTVPVTVDDTSVDEVARRLSLIRATPVVWLGSSRYDQTVIYGFYKDWSINITYDTVSDCSLTIEGLS